MVTAFRTAFALLAAVAAGTAAAADWPRWRGPNGAGTAEGTLPDKPDLLWKAELPGTGAGFPIIVGGKVFLQTASADGTTRTLVCLTATDGKTAAMVKLSCIHRMARRARPPRGQRKFRYRRKTVA